MNLSALSPWVISQIRTYVPIAVGSLLTWLAATLHIVIDTTSEAALVTLCVGLLSAGYYGLVHLAEQRWPKVGVLLGVPKLPIYTPPAPSGPSIAEAILAPTITGTPAGQSTPPTSPPAA